MSKSSKKKKSKPAAEAVRGAVPKQALKETRAQSTTKTKRDPVKTIELSNAGRVEELVPIRHSRMSVSPFTFYRGAAALMAADLGAEPNSGIIVQCCGDCHLLNVGAFATPERNIIVDINDFDETHPAPFEWDIKRLVASLALAGSAAGISASAREKAGFEMARSYQREMAKHAQSRMLDIWYTKVEFDDFINLSNRKFERDRRRKNLSKELTKSSPEALQTKLIEKQKGGVWRFKEMRPLLFHQDDTQMGNVRLAYNNYLKTIPDDLAALLGHFEITDMAMKVVGTGSVGTYCAVVLLVGANDDFLVLQVKEARQSVLEPYTKPSKFENSGQRIVSGQRIMQSASDMFLGWTRGEGARHRHFFIRQLRDVKMSPNPALWDKTTLIQAAGFAGRVLAKAHAKSGEAQAITEYLGKSDKFAKSMGEYALSYAELTEADYELFVEACRSGRLPTEASEVGS